MAELVVEALLSATFQKLFDLLTTPLFRSFFREKESIDNRLKLLNERLNKADLLLNDAEGKQITDEKVKKWLNDLNDVIFRADDLVEDINAEARSEQERESGSTMSILKKAQEAVVTPFTNNFDKFVQGELDDILTDLGFLLDRASTLRLKHIDGTPKTSSFRSLTAPLREEREVHGRDADKEKILSLLLSGEVFGKKLGVIPIVGMGGLGKTTLAQLVYNHDRANRHEFQLKAWVTVSTEFDIWKIAKTIMKQISPRTPDIEEPAELQRRLKEALRGNKFLLVLDDVWDESYNNWDLLRCTFPSEESGSRIIVTTRSKKVAANVKTGELIYELSQVSELDCWNIFVDHALDGDAEDPHLQDIGKKIVKKCKGVPLAVKSIGGLLRSEKSPEKWESILRSHVWESRINELILPSLWLSYCYLPSRLKQCFAYCSTFPKDYPIEKEKIILFWMAEGFLQFDKKEERLEEVGQEYLDDLISRSLFQSSSHNKSLFVMHDLVHDLAMFVSREFCFNHDTDLKHLSKKTRHISYRSPEDHKLLEGTFEANHLRTFIVINRYLLDTELVEEVLGGGRYLRVLSLPPDIVFLMSPDSFSNLKHLRYLDISGSEIEELPCSICSLYNLQTLLLANCERLTCLPTDMGRLTNLRHLVTTETPLKEMPPHMGNLKELQTLTSFVLGEHGSGSSIKELGALQNLREELSISGLQNVESVEEAQEANLRDKDKLGELTLEWEGDVTDTRREVLDALKPHPNLSKLEIRRYAASSFPDWVGDSVFSNLLSVHLTGNGDFCHALPPLGQLPSLKRLVIKDFHGVEKIGPEFYTGNGTFSITPFERLEFLWFSGLKSWKEWSFVGQDGKEDGCFPRLKVLRLYRCPNLAGSLPKCDAIERLEIWGSYELMESLPLDNFPKLKELMLWECESLKELIVDSPDVIERLDFVYCNKLEFPGSHHYVHVKRLRIRYGCDSMKTLPLDYFPRLEDLDLYGCQNLESLTFTEETRIALQSLKSLHIGSKNFRSLPEHMHRLLPSLSVMRMWDCEIEAFPKGGLPSNLNTLEMWRCCKLVAQSRHWNLQGLTSLRHLGINDCEDLMLDSFPEGLLPSSLTSFRLDRLPHLKSLNGSAFQNVTCLEELELRTCEELQLLPREVLLPTSLRSLHIFECPFLERRYQEGKGEDWNQISHIPCKKIRGKTTDELKRNIEEGSTSTNV